MSERASVRVRPAWAVACWLTACGDPRPDHLIAPPPAALVIDGGQVSGLQFDPPAEVSAVEPVSRVMLRLDQPVNGARVVLVRGALTSAEVRDLGRAALPQSLSARVVPAVIWAAQNGALITAAPSVALDAGAVYTLALSAPAQAWSFAVNSATGRAALARVWPSDAVAASAVAVWCGASAFDTVESAASFAPAEPAGAFAVGTGAEAAAPNCLSWRASGGLAALVDSGLPAVSPAVAWVDGEAVALQPVVLVGGVPAPPVAALACSSNEVELARGCVEVQDDRAVVRSPARRLLWTIGGAGPVLVRSTGPSERFVVRLPPFARTLAVTSLDEDGDNHSNDVDVAGGAPRAHVVINEVMANPRGSEPAQEWVELYNDGRMPAELESYTLEDAQGTAVLPPGELAPGAFALVVGPAYVANLESDAVAPAGTMMLTVNALALANDGERLALRDASGQLLSVFPAIKSKNGLSAARRQLDTDDADPAGFALCALPAGSTPGAPN